VARRRFLKVSRDLGVDVLAVSESGAVRTIHSAESVDISHFAPALRRPPDEQIRDHIDSVRYQFDNLASFWRAPDGTTSALSDGLTDASASVEGDWPSTRLVVTMRHPKRPGLLLRRTLALFDDAGSPISDPYADIRLMEDLETNHLTPADEAVAGVLDI
jgi:hypothetical protein